MNNEIKKSIQKMVNKITAFSLRYPKLMVTCTLHADFDFSIWLTRHNYHEIEFISAPKSTSDIKSYESEIEKYLAESKIYTVAEIMANLDSEVNE